MEIHVFPWISMDFHGFPWISGFPFLDVAIWLSRPESPTSKFLVLLGKQITVILFQAVPEELVAN